jgi:glycogen synthase
MHVLITCDAIGGVWTYTRELVRGLVRRNHRVSLISFGELPDHHQLLWMRDLPLFEYYGTDFPLEWQKDSASGVAASMDYMERLIALIKPDVLHSNQYCYGSVRCSIPRIVVAHSDVLSWRTEVLGQATLEDPWLLWYRYVVTAGVAEAEALIAPSRWMLDTISQYYGKAANGSVIYNGCDSSQFSSSFNKSSCVLCAGRIWDPGKQVGILLARRQMVPVQIAGPRRDPESKVDTSADCNPDGSGLERYPGFSRTMG